MPSSEMSDTTPATGGARESTVITAEGSGKLSVTEAARALAGARYNKPKDHDTTPPAEASLHAMREAVAGDEPPEGAMESTAPSGDAGDAGSQIETTGETGSVDSEVDLPPIEPPRSWTKEDKALFTSLPRETQERIAERERSRESDFLRRQNEAADKLKGLTTKEQAVERARAQYEAALPILLQNLRATHAGEFADIKTMDDVEKMATEDWPRYVRWDAAQKRLAGVQREMLAAQQRQAQDNQQRFEAFANAEDAAFKAETPEMADEKKAADLQSRCLSTLHALGFADADIAATWNGKTGISLRDHRVQLLIRDATFWREARAKAKAAQPVSVPPVQRPGVSQGKGALRQGDLATRNQRIDNTRGHEQIRAAADFVRARRAAH